MEVGRLKLATFDKLLPTTLSNRQPSLVVSLSHWASTFVCSTFSVMQRIVWVRQWQLILVVLCCWLFMANIEDNEHPAVQYVWICESGTSRVCTSEL